MRYQLHCLDGRSPAIVSASASDAAPRPASPPRDHPTASIPPPPSTGLTSDDVAARRAAGQGNPEPPSSGRTYWAIIRENVFTFINDVIFLLGIALVIVGRPLDAVVSLAVISTNIVVSVGQEVRAKRTLARIAVLIRPTAAVVRDGMETVLPPERLVLGDLIVARPGDQIVLDGRVVVGRLQVDESQLTGESDLMTRIVGDEVYSGSFCIGGAGRYVVEQIGEASLANRITANARSFRRVLTPLQQEVNKVIRVALLIVVYVEILLVLTSLFRLSPAADAIGQATILAGLVPNGLFVSIAVAYALGAVRMVRFGVLVQQANAIESLSHVDVLCTDKTGTLTTNHLVLVEIIPVDGDLERFRRTLGTFAASAATKNKTTDAVARACPAEPVATTADVPFSSTRKWSAIAFDGDVATRGTLVLGAPQFLRPSLAPWPDDDEGSWVRLEPIIADRAARGLRVLLLSASPDPSAVAGQDDDARLGGGFRALGLAVLEDELRPEAGATLARFAAADVRIKIISGDDPDTVAALARQAGLDGPLPSVSGIELEEMDDHQLGIAADEATIFGRITPAQKERLVDALRARGGYVAMIGDGVNDVLSLKKADLAIAMASGSQATRSVADIILTDDSFAALAPAVEEGQRILNGMSSILSLFLARIATMGLIIVSSMVVGVFPIAVRNGSVITLFSVGIPAVLLAVWAQPGRRRTEGLAATISHFVVPAAIVTSLAGLLVLYGTLTIEALLDAPVSGGLATPVAQASLTTFLVMAGLALVVFVEPPTDWMAVIRPKTSDRRPTVMAVVLGLVYLGLTFLEPARSIFALEPLGWREASFLAVAVVAWLIILRLIWRHHIIERLVGAPLPT